MPCARSASRSFTEYPGVDDLVFIVMKDHRRRKLRRVAVDRRGGAVDVAEEIGDRVNDASAGANRILQGEPAAKR